MIFEKNDRLLFAGDSVTDMGSDQPCGYGSAWEAIGKGYVRQVDNLLAAVYPETPIMICNAGVNGNASVDLAARFERDVLAWNPHWISILIGANDVWRQFDSPGAEYPQFSPQAYADNLDKMLALSKAKAGVKGIFVLSPYYMEPLQQDPMRARMNEYAAIAREKAEKYGAKFVDLQAMFDRYFAHRHTSCISWDRIHPNYIGATLIAREFLKHCDFDFNREL